MSMSRTKTILILVGLLGAPSPCFSQSRDPDQSLDSKLLEDLSSDLLEGLSAEPGSDSSAKAKPQAEANGDQPAGPARAKLPETIGEDIGAADAPADNENPLFRIEQKMRQVEQRLAEQDASESTQNLQQEIAKELAQLLEQLQQQQQQQQNQNSSQQQQQQNQQQQTNSQQQQNQKQNASNRSNQPASKPARESEERTGKTEEKIKPEDLQELFQRAWGNLPAQVRERMRSAAQEQFLPKYETLIEDYYKRLAEEGRR